ncbi:CoA transferase [Streptomyces daqingensis]|uniref:CoA transferase n=1 Tax=Streptomyces daqingensis TaxID=1472640 RepID=A0ABQ2LVI5_9ACTN|nr:CaiB/BaiF CoA-transferase family protein [Streptomyces daqingensis]GGO43648.1 CoA transferase [Streptomyces daqingensis]
MTAAAGSGGGPLRGVRVVELAGIGPGPFAAMVLGDLGADVVRVERPGGAALGIDPRSDVTNRNKRSVTLDLKTEEGVAATLGLVARADVLIEGNRPGVAERLGVGPEECLARNPRLVYGRMTGWGQDGPLAQRAGHDIGYIALTGVLGLTGAAAGPPYPAANLLGDYAGGSLYLVIGVLAALQHARAEGGEGQVVDAAIVDGTSHLSAMIHGMMAAGAWQDRRGANLLDGGAPFYGTYETSDGGFMAVGALEPQFYSEFVRLLGAGEDLPDRADPGAWEELRTAVAARFRERTRDEWAAVFEDSDACVAPVLSLREAPGHPHLAARGTFVEHGGITQPAPAPRFSATPTAVGRPPAVPGADTADVARDWGVPGLVPEDSRPEGSRSAASTPQSAPSPYADDRGAADRGATDRTGTADRTPDDTDPAEDADA